MTNILKIDTSVCFIFFQILHAKISWNGYSAFLNIFGVIHGNISWTRYFCYSSPCSSFQNILQGIFRLSSLSSYGASHKISAYNNGFLTDFSGNKIHIPHIQTNGRTNTFYTSQNSFNTRTLSTSSINRKHGAATCWRTGNQQTP
jgi:hypothetical protein